ncbi:hypothetical protein SAMN05216343_10593 [Oscillibacter sp. PC13]|jgi:hypothetical protein|uniref:hypothetical protein n=1 Tax=Oscillibacter sp. PC13 TaxID=1855299 RepID=UPI0008E4E73F|nr:hypothetical protein [Oscillibacter sp. PC13]SFP28305.1 hypothetical protein SAMN05216343_10593 [Oscillibacter sp. PC13]
MIPAVQALLNYTDDMLLPKLLRENGYWDAIHQNDLQQAAALEAEALFQLGLALGLELGRLPPPAKP